MKEYQVTYFIMFHNHEDLQVEETMSVYSTDKIYVDDDDLFKFVNTTADAEQYVFDIYANQGEERLVDIPDYVWDDFGDTLFEVTEVVEM